MNRFKALSLIGFVMLGASACERTGAAEQQRERQANAELQQANNQATQQEQSAKASADKDIQGARADFERTREDYRHQRETDLIDMDQKIAALEGKAMTAKDKLKTELDVDLSDIRAKRAEFVRDMKAVETASAAAWDDLKARANRDWDALKSAIDKGNNEK
jgi:hypothetical protein